MIYCSTPAIATHHTSTQSLKKKKKKKKKKSGPAPLPWAVPRAARARVHQATPAADSLCRAIASPWRCVNARGRPVSRHRLNAAVRCGAAATSPFPAHPARPAAGPRRGRGRGRNHRACKYGGGSGGESGLCFCRERASSPPRTAPSQAELTENQRRLLYLISLYSRAPGGGGGGGGGRGDVGGG